MHLQAREEDGTMTSFEVDDDFMYPDRKFYCNGKGYVKMYLNGGRVTVSRLIVGLEKGDARQAHHVNENIKDNKRCNLRTVTCQENNRFKGPMRRSTTGLKGVYKMKNGRYKALLTGRIAGRQYNNYLGTFATEKEAGLAYDRSALARFAGAYLNFPQYIHNTLI